MRFLGLLLLSLLTLTGPLLGQEETLRKGDQIVIDIKGVPLEEREQIYGTYTISDEGLLELYLIGTIRALGEKPSTLATKLERLYLQNGFFTQPNILISFDKAQENRYVTVIGEVVENGAIRHKEGLTLLEALSMAGGFTDNSEPRAVKLVRDNQARVHDCNVILKNPTMDVLVLPGDKIFVPQRGDASDRRRSTDILKNLGRR